MKKPLYDKIDRECIRHYYDNVHLYKMKPLFISSYEISKIKQDVLKKSILPVFIPIVKFLNKLL